MEPATSRFLVGFVSTAPQGEPRKRIFMQKKPKTQKGCRELRSSPRPTHQGVSSPLGGQGSRPRAAGCGPRAGPGQHGKQRPLRKTMLFSGVWVGETLGRKMRGL